MYDKIIESGYPHLRLVKWLCSIPRTKFSQGALYEIGSALSFFQIKNYVEEFRAAPEGKSQPLIVDKDDTIGLEADEIEATTRHFILKRLAQELKGHPLAEFVAHLLGTMGYRTRFSPEVPDGGIDIVAHKDELGFEPPIVNVQVKSSEGNIGDPVVSSLDRKVASGEYGLLVLRWVHYYEPGKKFCKSNLRLVDGDELFSLVLEHYEQFDSRYKGLLPLKKVYFPVELEEAE